jgi:hypothetical protein
MGFRVMLPSRNYVRACQSLKLLTGVKTAHLFPALLVSTPLDLDRIAPHLPVVRGTVKLGTPRLRDMLQPVK